ncbi:uncharacterized protein ces2b isoform X2 [Cheilinus undulatus]|uniref:uncharacterized protein ces2b isoform X2 n=1 Tax=Cheilinus undulatus TaxID=241271 RepID=UPI001BD2C78A|nr:uncharacterized protein ces2b isoform X2 [Cheilinus undulatus]
MRLPAIQTFLCLASVLFLRVSADPSAPEVHTALGSLKGEYVSVKGKETGAYAYLGIPFAKPPVGPALRLAAPQPVEAWGGVRDATKQPPLCIQPRAMIMDLIDKMEGMKADLPDASEDCLYLNIYTPANRANDAKLPVMVWIHGGGFTIGSASVYDGSALAAYQDVVVVLIQYRLGILGFLSTGDEHMPGNVGLLDQVQALKWVQQHIHNFGGNPDLVTIFGESAGGVSVSLLLLSPLTEGLIHRGIAESGTAAMDILMTNDPLPMAQYVANMSGCSLDSTQKIAECMKNLDLETILDLAMDQSVRLPINVDGHFLRKPVDELFNKHELLKIPFMTGVNNDEGGWLLVDFMAPKNWTEGLDLETVKSLLSFFFPDPVLSDLLINEYMGNGADSVKNRNGYTELIGDLLFTVPAIKCANAHRDAGAPVYLYEYQHPPQFLQSNRPSFVKADHGDEIFTVLGYCFTTKHVTLQDACPEEEEELSKIVMSYWGNFARTGYPNGEGLVHWPKYGAEEKYLKIDLKEQTTGQQLKKDRFDFLSQTLPEKMKQPPEVHTALGSLKGEYVSVKGKETGAYAYLGIPFAKPPVGPALRLAAPQPVEAWGGMRDATKQPPLCIQPRAMLVDLFDKMGGLNVDLPDVSEDCLYLNIYSPANRANDAKLPVMVWIHGGAFTIGSASVYDGSALAAYQDVVVVLIQYRLGILGFLSTGDEHMPGNVGLLDQVQALKWVQQHIHNFGGNPDSVTIFGESAGGVSVSLLLLSPLAEGLIHCGIAESGTAAIDSLMTNDPLPMAQHVANMSGCSLDSTQEIADCMKNLDLETILDLGMDQSARPFVNVDGHFLRKPVDELFDKHELLKIPFMTGINNDEGGWLLAEFMAPKNWTGGLDLETVKSLLSIFYPDPVLSDLLINEYMGNGEDPVKNRNGYTELLGDMTFLVPAIKCANAHRDAGAPVYLYEYQHPPQFLQSNRPSFVKADHGDEIFTVFGICFTTKHVTLKDACPEEEEELSKIVMSYWGNFARTGSPNGEGLVHWPKYGAEEKYLKIDLKEQTTGQQLKKDRFDFLSQTLPNKMKQSPEVHTALGSLKGEYVSVKGKETGAYTYLGIPFAKPPVGPALRLAAPQPVEAWGGVRDATKQPPLCIQPRAMVKDLIEKVGVMKADFPDVSEDCLYLNIFTPANRANDAKLPVMVWIHGGGFAIGSASMYDGSALAAYQDVVVVLIQYRLGVLGLLSTGDEHMPGNVGLLDQVQALKWVQQHIHNFGGNPDLVTIFGESAGGVSVSLLLLSPLTQGLIHRGIAESGTAAIDSLMTNDPLPMAQHVANMSGCSLDSTQKIADCMKNLDLETILDLGMDLSVRPLINVDGHFLRKSVDELFNKHELLKIPFMTGVNNDEGGWLLVDAMGPKNWTEGLDLETVKNLVSFFFPDPVLSDLLIKEYIGNGEDPVKNRNGYTELLGDMTFIVPAIKCANAHRDAGAPVYMYEYMHPPQFMQAIRPSFVKADHGDEIFTVLGYCFTTKYVTLQDVCPEEEEELSKIMMSYWGNFARTGSPNGEGLVHWPKYGAEEKYLKIDLKEQTTGQQLKKGRFILMSQTLPEKMKQHKENMDHSEL